MQTTILLSPVFNSNSQREVKLNTKVRDFHEKRTAVLWILLYTPSSFLKLLHSLDPHTMLKKSQFNQPVKMIDYCLFYYNYLFAYKNWNLLKPVLWIELDCLK